MLVGSRYARFHLYTIETKFSEVYNFLSKGNFSFRKTHREFSMKIIMSLSKGTKEQVIYLT